MPPLVLQNIIEVRIMLLKEWLGSRPEDDEEHIVVPEKKVMKRVG